MAQTIALQARAPEINWGRAMGTAQDLVRNDQLLQKGNLENQGRQLELGQAQGKAAALDQFRMKRAAGDTNAMKALDAYPMIQAQMHKAFESMKPDQVAEAKKVANEFWKSYTYIQRFMPGTPEQAAAWNKEIDRLSSGGYIDEETAGHWKQSGPSDLILDQARMVRSAVDSYKTKDEQTVPENVQSFEDHMESWDKEHVPKRGAFGGDAPGDEEWASYRGRRAAEERRARQQFGLPDTSSRQQGRHFNFGEGFNLDEGGVPDNQTGITVPDANVSADNAKQVDLGKSYESPKTPANAQELKANVAIGEYYQDPSTGDVYRRVR